MINKRITKNAFIPFCYGEFYKGVFMDQKLETFLTLCKTMHYGRAAELLHLSQPAVSKHIQALEAQYGVRLFTYQARRLQKTREGDILEQYAFSLRYNEEMLLARLHENQRLCSASARQNPSAIIFCCRKSAAFLQNRTSSFTFLSTTRPIFSQNWKTANSILLFWKDFLTSSAMTFPAPRGTVSRHLRRRPSLRRKTDSHPGSLLRTPDSPRRRLRHPENPRTRTHPVRLPRQRLLRLRLHQFL